MEREKVVERLREMLSLAGELQKSGRELEGDMARVAAILKEKIRLLDPLGIDSVQYFA